LIDGFDKLMNSADDFCGPVNLGNPVECTMLELAETIIDLTQSHSSIQFLPMPSDDPARRRPDITLARNYLNWEPHVDLREGLEKTIDYFKRLRMERGSNTERMLPSVTLPLAVSP
jgi:UDP-glucuronate decarboxylase